jgi:hypothetical protein
LSEFYSQDAKVSQGKGKQEYLAKLYDRLYGGIPKNEKRVKRDTENVKKQEYEIY